MITDLTLLTLKVNVVYFISFQVCRPKMLNWNSNGGDETMGTSGRNGRGSVAGSSVTEWLGSRPSAAGQSLSIRPGVVHYPNSSSMAAASVGGPAGASLASQNQRLVLTLTGWRRRCLFGLLLTLTIIVIINLSLTLWLLRSMQFSLVRSPVLFDLHILTGPLVASTL